MKADGRRRARFDSFLRSSVGDHLWLIILAFPSAADSSWRLEESRPLTIGAKVDVLSGKLFAGVDIKFCDRFTTYLTNANNDILLTCLKMTRRAERNRSRGHRSSHARPCYCTPIQGRHDAARKFSIRRRGRPRLEAQFSREPEIHFAVGGFKQSRN